MMMMMMMMMMLMMLPLSLYQVGGAAGAAGTLGGSSCLPGHGGLLSPTTPLHSTPVLSG